jgi:hypothetical protein
MIKSFEYPKVNFKFIYLFEDKEVPQLISNKFRQYREPIIS